MSTLDIETLLATHTKKTVATSPDSCPGAQLSQPPAWPVFKVALTRKKAIFSTSRKREEQRISLIVTFLSGLEAWTEKEWTVRGI